MIRLHRRHDRVPRLTINERAEVCFSAHFIRVFSLFIVGLGAFVCGALKKRFHRWLGRTPTSRSGARAAQWKGQEMHHTSSAAKTLPGQFVVLLFLFRRMGLTS
jgi:hypothetical protein